MPKTRFLNLQINSEKKEFFYLKLILVLLKVYKKQRKYYLHEDIQLPKTTKKGELETNLNIHFRLDTFF